MSKQTEALKLALEALEWSVEQGGGPECEHESGGAVCFCKENKAITALREALAEQPAQQQEPVAWVNQANLNSAAIQRNRGGQGDTHTWSETPTWDHSVPLYTSPPAQPQQEPFGHVTVRRLSRRFENHHDQYQFYPSGERPYLDHVDECHAVYTAPQPCPTCEALARTVMLDQTSHDAQRKPLVGLTDQEIVDLWTDTALKFDGSGWHAIGKQFARAIEAAHGIKE